MFFFKYNTAYEMRISDWSSDVCSSDRCDDVVGEAVGEKIPLQVTAEVGERQDGDGGRVQGLRRRRRAVLRRPQASRSEEHTSELQSLMRISYAVFCLKKKTPRKQTNNLRYVLSLTTTTQ